MTPKNNSKTIVIAILAVLLLLSGILLTLFIGHRRLTNPGNSPISTADNQPNISLGNVHHTATRDGVREWTLDAQSAQLINAKNQAVFQQLTITFFPKNSAEVYLTAKQGILHTDSNDIEVSGRVVVQNDYYKLTTAMLHYKHQERVLFSDVPVDITSRTARITGDFMSHNLDTNKTMLKGNVKGVFDDHIIM